ncbi:hypothetical protein F0562_028592 [Nyssa sinensis]|uniref:Uncharacterized protein n=1 Tax=Nyssa sinensis TaxID=561372 RepID=A0A5J5B0I5_9ASTE|nr:hypothetical protein F0562_028592 [Nyssa sinensis]
MFARWSFIANFYQHSCSHILEKVLPPLQKLPFETGIWREAKFCNLGHGLLVFLNQREEKLGRFFDL